ncbi:hypothetical protein QYE76_026431 [Lolium multiflorum]|uniref:F-box domain-containing protein n=1 Tax=Lolium multiflorum TaxID=4521 RepID=A0AAD8VVK7_LOLMU|nr:hypothetical protein QYE76_026431 [Lolium multiflorum]
MDATDGDSEGPCVSLPYDVLLDILRRLRCRALAESRRVCRAWRDAVDAHDLLLPHFFPRGVFPGIFTQNFGGYDNSSFFAPPAPRFGRRLRGAHDGPVFRHPVFRYDWASVVHYCNGLLLLKEEMSDRHYVCNPATVRCAHLPVLPETYQYYPMDLFLAFDPAASLHYEVFLLPEIKTQPEVKEKIQPCKQM